jgi:hypothetical protein
MVAPKKQIMGRGESPVSVGARVSSGRAKTSRKPVVKVKPKPDAKAEVKSNVKKVIPKPAKQVKRANSQTDIAIKNQRSGKSAKWMSKSIKNYNKNNPMVKKLPTKIINSGI